MIADASTVVKFVLYGCENIANIFLLVMGCTAVWLTFAYKLQVIHHLRLSLRIVLPSNGTLATPPPPPPYISARLRGGVRRNLLELTQNSMN